jgi:general secretion pathway protein G
MKKSHQKTLAQYAIRKRKGGEKSMKIFWQKEKGFTLIELLIVVAIIGIVAGIAIPRFLGARTVARVTRAFADMRTIANGLEMYFTTENEYPVLADGVTDLATATGLDTYITSVPEDQFGTDAVPNFRYYSEGDPATMWLIISNGPDLSADIAADDIDFDDNPVSGELGGPNGVNPTGDDTYYGVGAGDGGWSLAKSATDKGDIGRGGP